MSAPAIPAEVIWHDVECGAYAADLPSWAGLAAGAAGPVLELGAGTGRVAVHLATAGADVTALDRSAALLAELSTRARAAGVEVETICADARPLRLERRFAAILAPMQFIHLLGGPSQRLELLQATRERLAPGGILAAALLADDASSAPPAQSSQLLPDVRELDGWVYTSQPLEVAPVAGGLEIRRLRQTVSPSGRLSEEPHAIRLDRLSADELEAEAETAGLVPRERIAVDPTDDHVGSVICVLEPR